MSQEVKELCFGKVTIIKSQAIVYVEETLKVEAFYIMKD